MMTPPLLLHPPAPRGLRPEDRALHVHLERLVVAALVDLHDRARVRVRRGVVDEDVEPAEPLDRRVDALIGCLDVAGVGRRRRACLRRWSRPPRRAGRACATTSITFAPDSAKLCRDREADALRCAGDECDLAFEAHLHGSERYRRQSRRAAQCAAVCRLRSIACPREPARRRDVAVPPPAPRQPGRLVRVGSRGIAGRGSRRQAGPALGRVLRVPLVPRDGARVVRGRRGRSGDERRVRLRQGRPRGAPRHRCDLHGGRASDLRSRRLADDGLHDSRRSAVLRRHVLPEGAISPPALGDHRRVARPAHRAARAGGPDHAVAQPHGDADDARRPDPPGHRRAQQRAAADRGPVRRRVGRVREGTEVPAGDDARALPARPRTQRWRRSSHRRDHLARRDGIGGHVRPPRWRVRRATPSTRSGWSLTSRRCSTTRRCSPGSTCTRGSSSARRGGGRCSTRQSPMCSATSASPREGSRRPRTPTPKARRGASTSGAPRRSRRSSAPTSRPRRSNGTASRSRATSRARTSSTVRSAVTSSGLPRSRTRGGASSTLVSDAYDPASTTRC